MNKRMLFTKYSFGNLFFWLLCASIGFVSYSFMSFSFQFLYELSDKSLSYHLLSSGLVLLLLGLVLFALRLLRLELGFRTLIYTASLILVFTYWGALLSNLKPQLAIYISFPVYFMMGSLLVLFITTWKRLGGLVMVLFYVVGATGSGLLSYFYVIDFELLSYFIRGAFFLLLFFIILYLLGFFGIFKTRIYKLLFIPTILFLTVLYPFDTKGISTELKRQKGKGIYLSSYKLTSRDIDVYINNEDELFFVENSRLNSYSYPLQKDYRLDLYTVLAQVEDLNQVLVIGDAPLGIFDIFDNFTGLSEVAYLPFDNSIVSFWQDLVGNDVIGNVTVLDSYPNFPSYDLVLFFPSYLNGLGSNSYVCEHCLNRVKESIKSTGTFVFVTNNEHSVKLYSEQLNLKFNNINSIKTRSGLLVVTGSELQSNFSNNTGTIKHRLLRAGIKDEYLDIKNVLDKGDFFSPGIVISSINSKNTLTEYFKKIFIFTLLGLLLLLTFKSSFAITSILFIFTSIGLFFGSYILLRQPVMFDLNTSYSFILPLFLLFCVIGLVIGLFLKQRFGKDITLILGSFCLLASAVYRIAFNGFPFTILILASLSSMVVFAFVNTFKLKVSDMVLIMVLASLGLGLGFVTEGVFDYKMLTYTIEKSYYYAVSIFVFFVYSCFMLLKRGHLK